MIFFEYKNDEKTNHHCPKKKMVFESTWSDFFKMLVLCISYIVWPLLFLFWRMTKLVKPTKEKVPKTVAFKRLEIEKEKKPTFLVHVTDLHLIATNEYSISHTQELFDAIDEIISPEHVILTGDIQDGRLRKSLFAEYGQLYDNWRPILDILQNHQNMKVIACAGNHDECGLSSYDNPSHIFINEFRDGNANEYLVQKHDIQTTSGNVRIVAFNPFFFPYSPCPFGTFLEPTKEMLNELSNSLAPPEKAIFNIIAMHNPQEGLVNAEDFQKVASPENNVRMTLCGHFHTPQPFYHVVGDCLEAIGPCPENGDMYANIVSIDSGVSNCSSVDLNETVAVITCPPAAEQFTSTSMYVPFSFRIRVAVFEKMGMNIEAFIDGISYGFLTKDCEDEKYIVYGLDVTVSQTGMHTLSLNGGITKTQNFIIGPTAEEREAEGSSFYLRLAPLRNIAIVYNIWIYALLFLPFVLNAIDPIRRYMIKFQSWLFNDGNLGTGNNISDFVWAIFVGPFYKLWRFSQASLMLQLNAIITQLVHYAIPFYLHVEKPFYAVMFLGVFFGKKYVFDRTTYIAEWFGTLGVPFPCWIFASVIGDGKYYCSTLYFLIAWGFVPLLIGFWAIYALSNMCDGCRAFFTSPTLYRDIICFAICAAGFLQSPAFQHN